MKWPTLPTIIPERARRRHPLVVGIMEGVLVAAMLAIAWAIALGSLTGVMWVAVIWLIMAAGRPSLYQATVAMALALMIDTLSGAPMGTRLLPLAGALLAGSFAPSPIVRWDVTHGVFALYGLGGYAFVESILAMADRPGTGIVATLQETFLTLVVLAIGGVAVAAVKIWSGNAAGSAGDDVPIIARSLR